MALALLAAGLAFFGIGLAHAEGAGTWFRSGCWAWLAAWFLVLLDRWLRGLPVQSYRGAVPYAQRAARQSLHFAVMLLCGVVVTGVLLAFSVLGDSTH